MTPITSAAIYDEISVSGIRLYQIAVILFLFLPGTLAIGYSLGRGRRQRRLRDGLAGTPVMSDTTQAAFQALLGLLLAFTFGNALTVSQGIKGAIANEAAAIGTAFLRVDYVADPGRTALQTALLAYAKTRVVPENKIFSAREETREFLETTLRAQAPLWSLTIAATRDADAQIQAFVAGAMNAVLDAHTFRISALVVPIAAFTQNMLLIGAIVTMFIMGNRAGVAGQSINWHDFAFAFFLCAVMYAIVDIRRPGEGLVRVDDSVMRATIFDMEQSLASRG